MMFGLITKREHDEIVAAKDAEIAEAKAWLANSRASHVVTAGLLRKAEERNGQLRRDLLIFTGPRDRNPDGTFRPTVRAGDMGEVVDA